MLPTTITRTLATGLSGAAIAGTVGAPAASAMPLDPLGVPGQPTDVPFVPSPGRSAPAAVETPPDSGLDLSSAAIGAAAGTGILVVTLAAGALAWRRPTGRERGAAGV